MAVLIHFLSDLSGGLQEWRGVPLLSSRVLPGHRPLYFHVLVTIGCFHKISWLFEFVL